MAVFLNHKNRLCAHSGMKQCGDSYQEKYSPVFNMISVRLIPKISKINNIDSKYIDFLLAFS